MVEIEYSNCCLYTDDDENFFYFYNELKILIVFTYFQNAKIRSKLIENQFNKA